MSNAVRDRPTREVNLEALPSAPGEPRRLLVPLKASGSRSPLFVVPGQFGEAFQFKRLAERLSEDIPFYSFEARGLWGDVEPRLTMNETVADYVAEIRSLQPSGPYFVGGFSAGGMIAWDIVHELQAAGEAAHLLLFDIGPASFGRRQQRKANRSLWLTLTYPPRVLTFHVRNAIGLHGARRKAYLRDVFRQEVRRFGRRLGLGRESVLSRLSLNAGRKPPPGHFAVRAASRELREGWEWTPQPQRFTLFRAHIQEPGIKRDETLGFTTELAPGGVDVRHVPGHHGFIFTEPHVFTVIAEIEAWIDRVDARSDAVPARVAETAERSLSRS